MLVSGRVKVDLGEAAHPATWLRISGALRPGWCGGLASGLADRGIDIVRGGATNGGAGVWEAEFELRCPVGDRPTRTEVRHLVEGEASVAFNAPLALQRYQLAASPSHGGSLLLQVEGRDRVGFLAALLRRLAYYALFPIELRLDTVGKAVRDCLWLRGGGGEVPRPGTQTTLAAALEALLRSGR